MGPPSLAAVGELRIQIKRSFLGTACDMSKQYFPSLCLPVTVDTRVRSLKECFLCCHHMAPMVSHGGEGSAVPPPNQGCFPEGSPAGLMETCSSPVTVSVERCFSSTFTSLHVCAC